MNNYKMMNLVLASSSPYRRQLLERFSIPFETHAPDVDESPAPGEDISVYTQRLSIAKAQSAVQLYPAHLIIGSDLCGVCQDRFIGKPGGYNKAVEQLHFCSGKKVDFHTGLCMLDSRSGVYRYVEEVTHVHFRIMDNETIQRYVMRDQPYNCAGSIRGEQLGIAMLEKIENQDPTALIGLPLIALARLLRQAGMRLP